MDEISQRLERAASLSQLPTGYVDVSEGWFAGLKRWIKRKILKQFQTAYVDVLARQQSAYNRAVADTIRDLTEQLAQLKEQLARVHDQLAVSAEQSVPRDSACEQRAGAMEGSRRSQGVEQWASWTNDAEAPQQQHEGAAVGSEKRDSAAQDVLESQAL